MVAAKKILAIQFKYLGDVVFIIPALRALREHRPDCELHVLVAEEAAPVLEHLPWLTRVWPMPRTRGKARIRESWPIIRALRREKFDFSVDFAGNDRGAILSFLCGARERLGTLERGRSWGRKICYTQTVPVETLPDSWVRRHVELLSACQIPPPKSVHLEANADPALSGEAARLLPDAKVICHWRPPSPKRNGRFFAGRNFTVWPHPQVMPWPFRREPVLGNGRCWTNSRQWNRESLPCRRLPISGFFWQSCSGPDC